MNLSHSKYQRLNRCSWVYQTAEELDGVEYWGLISTYGGGGFIQNLATVKSRSLTIIDEMMENLWIDRGTRVVFIDFTVYNANINLFCVIKSVLPATHILHNVMNAVCISVLAAYRLVIEFPATGGALPSWNFRTVKLLRYVTTFDFFVLACEGIFALFIFYYIVEEILEVRMRHIVSAS